MEITQLHRLCGSLQQAIEQRQAGIAIVEINQNRHKFIAADPRQRIAFAQSLLHARGQGDQQLVAYFVPVLVIDALEAIKVKIDDRQRLGAPLGTGHALVQTIREQQSIGQTGQGIKVRHVLQLVLVLLERGDVGKQGHVMLRLAVAAIDRRDGQHLGIDLTVLAFIPDLTVPMALVDQVAPHGDVIGIVLAPRLQQPRVLAQNFLAAIAGNAREGIVDVENRAVSVSDDDALTGIGKDTGSLDGALGLLALGYITRCSKHAQHPALIVTVDAGVVEHIGDPARGVSDRQRVVGHKALGKDLLVALAGLHRVGKVVTKVGANQCLARDAGRLDAGLVDVGDLALGADRYQWIETRFEQTACVVGCLLDGFFAMCQGIDHEIDGAGNFRKLVGALTHDLVRQIPTGDPICPFMQQRQTPTDQAADLHRIENDDQGEQQRERARDHDEALLGLLHLLRARILQHLNCVAKFSGLQQQLAVQPLVEFLKNVPVVGARLQRCGVVNDTIENKRRVVYGPAYPLYRLLIWLVVELRLGPAKQLVRLQFAFNPQ